MKADRFEDLVIYRNARLLTGEIYEITNKEKFSRDYYLVNQMRRSAVSIMSNIAEGFERNTDKEFAQFLFIAKGSSGELRAQMDVAFDQMYVETETYKIISLNCERISGMIGNMIKYLKKNK